MQFVSVRFEGAAGPLVGARVVAEWSSRYGNERGRTKFTDSQGLVRYDNVPDGAQFTVTAQKSGHEFERITASVNGPILVTVRGAIKTFKLAGRVWDRFGRNGVPGVTVTDGNGGTTVTNAVGEFELFAPYNSRYRLEATKTGVGFGNIPEGTVLGDVDTTIMAMQ